MEQKAIETLSISAVKNSIDRTEFLSQFISENDKEPSFDGYVNIYKDKSKRKDKFRGRLPVQVKGTVNNDFSNKIIKFKVQMSDLRNYLYSGGIIFFVVYINCDGLKNKIYYAELTPIKLRNIIKDDHTRKYESIELKEFPDDSNKKATIFLNCYDHCCRQSSFVNKTLYTLESLSAQGVLESISTSISGYGLDEQEAFSTLLNNGIYMYANIKGGAVPQPLEFMPQSIQFANDVDATISVNGNPFYNSFTRIQEAQLVTLAIGSSFRCTFPADHSVCKAVYKRSDMLRVLAKDLEFIIAVIDHGQFEINGHAIQLNYTEKDKSDFEIDNCRQQLVFLKKIVQLLDMLKAFDDICLSKLTSRDKKHINHLVTAFVDKKTVSGLGNSLMPVHTVEVADFKFILAFIRVADEDGTYRIFDFFKTKIEASYENENGGRFNTSQYYLLHDIDLLSVTNIRYDVLLPSYQEVKGNDQIFTQANAMLLRLLISYDVADERDKSILLETATDFAEWLMESPETDLPYNIRTINRLQVIRRQRDFEIDEIKELCEIAENQDSQEEIIIAANLLLGNQKSAEMHFMNLKKEEQEEFMKYPICRFWTTTNAVITAI